MAIRRRTMVVAIAGALAGLAFFSLDLLVDLYLPDAVVLHAFMEAIEFLIIGPGVGMACALLALRLFEARSAAAAAEQARRLEWLGRLAATMAHEVRNPLHTARLAADGLREELPAVAAHPLTADLDAALVRIDAAVGLVYRLARPPTGSPEAVDAAILLREAAAAWPGFACAASSQALVRADPALLRTAIDNLLRNAVEASDPAAVQGSVVIAERRVRIRIANPGRLPEGVGAADMRAVRPGSDKPGGLGLGVAIAAHIAALAGGRLDLLQEGALVVAVLDLPEAP
ncbi:MAG: hypothetical protein RLZZ127_1208 [Planctomycetota bacterium]|jgi:signal transduction histidine kinase